MKKWKPIIEIYFKTILFSSLITLLIGFFTTIIGDDLDIINSLAAGVATCIITLLFSGLLSIPFFVIIGLIYFQKESVLNKRQVYFLLHLLYVGVLILLFYFFDQTAWHLPILPLLINMIFGAILFSRRLDIKFWLF